MVKQWLLDKTQLTVQFDLVVVEAKFTNRTDLQG